LKTKVINLFGGPGTGKSTTAAAIFAELKFRGVNCEYVQEYAKDKAWEFGTNHLGVPKVFQAQEYIFGKQHFRIRRCAADVDVVITDCPLFLGLVYMPDDFPIPSLRMAIREAYDMYDNLNIFLVRNKPYNPKGRFQDEDRAKELDIDVKKMLDGQGVPYHVIPCGRESIQEIIDLAGL
jgi:nicotinamide riboside kinase